MQSLQGFVNIFKIKDLREKILFTLGVLAVYRLGGFVPLPGVNSLAIAEFFSKNSNNLFGLYNTFVGGALQRASIFSLGIMPYISASIIIQLMGTVVPTIAQLQKQGQEGRAKLTQWTRYGTILISALQSWAWRPGWPANPPPRGRACSPPESAITASPCSPCSP